jgi:hypothetical protein
VTALRMASGGVFLLGNDLAYLTELSNELRSVSRSVVISAAPRPVRRALSGDFGDPAVALVCLDGSENIGDVRQLLSEHPATTFLFLSRTSPPRSSMAHAVRSAGGEIMSSQDKPIVIAATVITLLAQRHAGPGQS